MTKAMKRRPRDPAATREAIPAGLGSGPYLQRERSSAAGAPLRAGVPSPLFIWIDAIRILSGNCRTPVDGGRRSLASRQEKEGGL